MIDEKDKDNGWQKTVKVRLLHNDARNVKYMPVLQVSVESDNLPSCSVGHFGQF